MQEILNFLADRWDFIIAVVGVLVIVWKIGQRLEKLGNQTEQALKSVKTLMVSNNFIVGALVEQNILSADKLLEVMNPYREVSQQEIDNLIEILKPSGNPISQQEVDQLIALSKKAVDEKELDYEKAKEFYQLAQKVADENSDEGLYQRLLDFASFILGKASSVIRA